MNNLRKKAENRSMRFIFSDGTIFSADGDYSEQVEAWVKAIKKLLNQFGVKKIMDADFLSRRSGSKERIISRNPAFRDRSGQRSGRRISVGSTAYKENDITYFVTHDHTAARKKFILDQISAIDSEISRVGLKVEVF